MILASPRRNQGTGVGSRLSKACKETAMAIKSPRKTCRRERLKAWASTAEQVIRHLLAGRAVDVYQNTVRHAGQQIPRMFCHTHADADFTWTGRLYNPGSPFINDKLCLSQGAVYGKSTRLVEWSSKTELVAAGDQNARAF